ncbi:MAG TPA: hypothetical protein V6C81_21590 [Planktothrix sp.]
MNGLIRDFVRDWRRMSIWERRFWKFYAVLWIFVFAFMVQQTREMDREIARCHTTVDADGDGPMLVCAPK